MSEPEDQTPEAALDPEERDPEAPLDDAYEQAIPADPAKIPVQIEINPYVDEYDALEQAQVVEPDDDDP
jgi:hypothetical protein